MGEIVPLNQQEDVALERIKAEVDSRISFLEKTGLPDPRPFDAEGVVAALNTMESALVTRAEGEILSQALGEITRIAENFR